MDKETLLRLATPASIFALAISIGTLPMTVSAYDQSIKISGSVELEGDDSRFHNPLNITAHYETTGPEIHEDWSLPKIQGAYKRMDSPDVFVAGTGTGGTLMGTRKFLKEKWTDIKIVAVEPEESPVMSGGEPGLHGIQGIGDGSKFLVDLDKVDDVITIKTNCAKTVAKYLALKYGLFVGISAGANVKAAFQWLRDNDKRNAITILCDRGDRYLSCM